MSEQYPDLGITQKQDGDYWDVVIPNLDCNTDYALQAAWVYSDKSFGTSEFSDRFNFTTPAPSRVCPINVVATWDATAGLNLTWTKNDDRVRNYVVSLTAGGYTRSYIIPATGTSLNYSWVLTRENNIFQFGNKFRTSFTSFTIQSIYGDGSSDQCPVTLAPYVDPICITSIPDDKWSVSSTIDGIMVSWQDDLSKALTYRETRVFVSLTNNPYNWVQSYTGIGPANIGLTTINDVYVKVNHLSYSDCQAPDSSIKIGKLFDPLTFDREPPNEVTLGAVTWSGEDLVISYTMPATNPPDRFKISLTNSLTPSTTATFPAEPAASSGTHSLKIPYSDFLLSFGYSNLTSSYTGLFQSRDVAGNFTAGVPFTTSGIVCQGTGIPAIITDAFGISAGYTAMWTAPSWAISTELYARDEGSQQTTLVYSGPSPAIKGTELDASPFAKKIIKIRHVGKFGCYSDFSTEKTVSPIDSIAFDDNPPTNDFTLETATVSDDSNGLFSFDKKVLFAWTENTDTDTAGYRIRFRVQGSTGPYTYMSVPGRTKTSSYLYGLKGGKTYEIAVSTFDIYGNTNESAWRTYDPVVAPVSNSLLPDVAITAGDMKLGYGIGGNNSQKGLYIAPDNYWYVQGNSNVSSAAYFTVGGETDKMVWDGAELDVTGTINANAGNFTGSVDVGSQSVPGQLRVYAGGNKFEVGQLKNSSGAFINEYGIQGTNASGQLFQLDTLNGIITNKGRIGGWTIDPTKLERGSVGVYAGMSSGSDFSFWAGSPSSGGSTAAKFYVKPDGKVKAEDITITGGSLKVGAGFEVASTTGLLKANDANIRGSIYVDNGVIGSVQIGGLATRTGDTTATDFGQGQILLNTTEGKIEFGVLKNQAGATIGTGLQVTSTADGQFVSLDTVNGIKAVKGLIAGWTLAKEFVNGLQVGSSINYGNNVGLYAPNTSSDSTVMIWAGGNRTVSPNFSVTYAGKMKAVDGVITGALFAGQGGFGTAVPTTAADITAGNTTGYKITNGWTIDSAKIKSTNTSYQVTLDGEQGSIIGGNIVGSNHYFTTPANWTTINPVSGSGNTGSVDYISSTGAFRLAGGKITYSTPTTQNPNGTFNVQTDLVASNIFLGSGESFSTDYLLGKTTTIPPSGPGGVTKSAGSFKLGNGSLVYENGVFQLNPLKKPFSEFKIALSVQSDNNGTAGDTTVVQNQDGFLTTGRAFFYSGNNYPGAATTRADLSDGDQGTKAFSVGDIVLSRKA
jgi:hypothetical protein